MTATKPAMVSKGNSFRVECSVPAEIGYCWLRHPNGTAVPVTVPDGGGGAANRSKSSRYRYTGDGLSFGQCHVTVDEAVASDTGPWLCALGLRDDRREMYGTVNITVSGEYEHIALMRRAEFHVPALPGQWYYVNKTGA